MADTGSTLAATATLTAAGVLGPKFVLSKPGAPHDYPTLGFLATADGAILDGRAFTPDLLIPPDAYWSVYSGASAETNITRYATPSEEFLDPTPEITAGWVLAYDTAANTFVPTAPTTLSLAWAATTNVTSGEVRQAPDGSWITSTATRTTRASFDATEETFWAAVLATSGTVEADALAASYVGGTVLSGSGIDSTGAADSTTAIQAKLTAAASTGADVYVPPGTFKITSPLTIAGPIRVYGPGLLNFTAGITNADAITITGDAAHLDGVNMANPNLLGSATGASSAGVHIKAYRVKITNCRIDSFQHGIMVGKAGEYADFTIIGNHVTNVLGVGGGPADAVGTAGEDRGDGITCYGTRGTIADNVITCKPGRDSRIGIDVEALPDQHPGSTTVHPESLVSVSGNMILGAFRRAIASEGVSGVAIVGNVIADPTWWGISVHGVASGVTVSGNAILYTRIATDVSGGAWAPIRSAIYISNAVDTVSVVGNVIRFKANAAAKAVITIQGASAVYACKDVRIAGNVASFDTGAVVDYGVWATGFATSAQIESNRLNGGIQLAGIQLDAMSDSAIVSDNFIDGNTVAGVDGIVMGAAGHLHARGNIIRRCPGTGIDRANGLEPVIVDNDIKGSAIGIEMFGVTYAFVQGNRLLNCTTPISNGVHGAGNNIIQNNTGYLSSARGSATIPNTATFVIVNHGLSGTPTSVRVSHRSTVLDPVYVNDENGTYFVVRRAGTTGDVTLFWQADL